MLAFLHVKGFAIIDELDVEFKDGLNVITGETGAGKSIIINALSSLLSARPPLDVVRGSSEQAEIVGHCFQEGQEYILRRIIGSQGRSRAFVNDSPVTAKRLEELGNTLVHVYGQHESQQLLSKESYVSLVDRFLGIQNETQKLAERVRRLSQVTTGVESGKRVALGREKEIELLTYQLEEIEREKIEDGEEERIRERLKVLRDAVRIRSILENVVQGLYEDEQSVHSGLSTAGGMLRPFADIEWMAALRKRMEEIAFDIEDVVASAKEREKTLEYEPAELEGLEERLSTIFGLKEKYGKIDGGIDGFLTWAKERLGTLLHEKTNVEDLEREREALSAEVNGLAAQLSERRRQGARQIERLVKEELHFLSMKGAEFRIEIADNGTIGENGRDDVEFLLSTNPGEPLKPLRRVASGGELSRIMLAVKKITGGDEDKTFVFDEIDAGIGGRVAEVVGRRLRELSGKHQIICITHLPQIAVCGEHHFLVQKKQETGTTKTTIRELSPRERTSEIARMLGGITITDKTLEQAEEMLENVEKSTHR
jgi:DNA repair protein RecN (Recombination protein N)